MRIDQTRKKRKKLVAIFLAAGLAAFAAGCQKKTVSEPAASETASEAGTSKAPSSEAPRETGETKKAEVEGERVQMVSGIVADAGMSTVTIKNQQYQDGITFLKEDAATSLAEGLLVDHEITVFYRGEIKDTDTSGVTVELLRDKREEDETSEAALISGKVVSIGMSVFTIESEDNRLLSFEQEPKPVNLTDGPVEEKTVRVLYSFPKGEQTEGSLRPELLTN